MKKIKKVVMAPVKFVGRHKVATAVVVTAVICTAINRNAIGTYNDFLGAEGLTDQYANFLENA